MWSLPHFLKLQIVLLCCYQDDVIVPRVSIEKCFVPFHYYVTFIEGFGEIRLGKHATYIETP